MSTKNLSRNALGGYKVPNPGGYIRQNTATFGAGTLTQDVAISVMGYLPKYPSPNWRDTDSFAAHIGGHYGGDMVTRIPTIWRRITWFERRECDGRCPAGNPPNCHCRPVPCFPRASLRSA